jgi:hypothetical protein
MNQLLPSVRWIKFPVTTIENCMSKFIFFLLHTLTGNISVFKISSFSYQDRILDWDPQKDPGSVNPDPRSEIK